MSQDFVELGICMASKTKTECLSLAGYTYQLHLTLGFCSTEACSLLVPWRYSQIS